MDAFAQVGRTQPPEPESGALCPYSSRPFWPWSRWVSLDPVRRARVVCPGCNQSLFWVATPCDAQRRVIPRHDREAPGVLARAA